jgi:ATP-binding cassette subfamily B protein
VVALIALATTALVLLQPLLTKRLIDEGILAGNAAVLLTSAGLLLAVALLGAALGWINRQRHVAVSADILFALRADLFRHLLRLSPGFYARWRSGDLLARLDGDIGEIQRFAVDGLLAAVSTTIGLAGAVVLMVLLSWQLALIAAVLLPLEWLLLRLLRPRIETTARALRERGSDLSAFLVERLPAVKTLQALGAEGRSAGALDGLQAAYRGDLLRQQTLSYLTGAVPGLLTTASNVLVFVLGGLWVIDGRLSLGTLIAFSAYLGRASGPVQTLLGLYVGAQRAKVSLRRVHELRTAAPAIVAPAVPRALPAEARGAIRLEGMRFGHGGRAVLDGLDLAVAPGEKLGLIGLSGAGKTTLIDLLHRHFDPGAGRILLDGVDLRDLDPAELRRKIAVVAQETVLFRATLRDNLRFAAPEAAPAAIEAAARQARVEPFAARLPQGYDTPLADGGAGLSGGERQRVAIARAVLQDPLVLVLDEATAGIDRATEAAIIAEIDALFAGRTRLLISHRAETLRGVDRLLELVDGRLAERQRVP